MIWLNHVKLVGSLEKLLHSTKTDSPSSSVTEPNVSLAKEMALRPQFLRSSLPPPSLLLPSVANWTRWTAPQMDHEMHLFMGREGERGFRISTSEQRLCWEMNFSVQIFTRSREKVNERASGRVSDLVAAAQRRNNFARIPH